MIRTSFGLLALFAACGFRGSGSEVDAGPIDAPIDGAVMPGCTTWTPLEPNVNPCVGPGTPAELVLSSDATFDTVSGVLSRTGGQDSLPGRTLTRMGLSALRVVNLSRLEVEVGNTLTLVGANAVLFVVHGDVRIAGTISASAALPTTPAVKAPGADSTRCMGARLAGVGDRADGNNRGGGGGGGGGLGSDGGSGGTGFDDLAGGTFGAADAENLPMRGGCAGGRGGDNERNGGGDQGGLGGGGGGAFAISARGALVIATSARLEANGAPGLGGAVDRAGGGGGGGGGTIALDGTSVTVESAAFLCAKGGGGGEASNDVAPGARGTDVDCTTARSPGGALGSATGGDGGDGGARIDGKGARGENGDQAGSIRGGGGGAGGGAGKILLRARSGSAAVLSTNVTPPELLLP